jgi:hypothetical protein
MDDWYYVAEYVYGYDYFIGGDDDDGASRVCRNNNCCDFCWWENLSAQKRREWITEAHERWLIRDRPRVGVRLFDRGANVAIATVGSGWQERDLRWELNRIRTDFERQNPDITFGVFRQPEMWFHEDECCCDGDGDADSDSDAELTTEEIRERLEADITQQVGQFIDILREQGRL